MPLHPLRRALWGAAAALAWSAACHASVVYDFEGYTRDRDGALQRLGSFTYVSPDFISSAREVEAADLAYCESFVGAFCGGAGFDFPVPDVVAFGLTAVPGGRPTSYLIYQFTPDALAHLGVYTSLGPFNVGQLSVSMGSHKGGAVPEPAAWMLSLLAFAATGAALRWRGRGGMQAAA